MKALTITQPWATLIAIGAKRFETRSWSTPYEGPLAIHAGKGLKPVGGERGLRDLCATEPFREVLTDAGYADPRDLPRGRVVAIARFEWCIETTTALDLARSWSHLPDPAEHEEAFGDYGPGRFAWALGDVEQNLSAPIRGELGLWLPPCLSHNPHADEICELAADHDGLHRDPAGREWNWGDS